MKIVFKILNLGFSPESNDKLLELVKKSHLGISVHHSILGSSLSLDEMKKAIKEEHDDFDLVILNSLGFSCPVIEVINFLKNRSPLIEIILISFKPNYQMAISAFRGGIRDIIEYPIPEEDFLSSLSRSLTYRSLFKRSENLTKILCLFSLFGDYRQFDSKEQLFNRIDDFLKNKFASTGYLILSCPKILKKSSYKMMRRFSIFWNEDLYREEFLKKKRKDFFDSMNFYRFKESGPQFMNKKSGTEMFYFLSLGCWEKIQYVGVFKVDGILENEMIGYLSRILYNAFQQILYLTVEKELSQLVHSDDVTGLFNQRRLQVDLQKSIEGFQKHRESFSILFIDIDHFKRINDSYGHLVGSLVLAEVAVELKKVVRETDLIYRYGGDEFVVILLNTEKEFAKLVGERILHTLKFRKFHSSLTSDEFTFHLSVSIGVAEYPKDAQSKEDILELADRMMYQAKEAGRGQVRVANEFFKMGQ